MIAFPNAKINLGLNIVGERPDGYHNLETVFFPVSLQDILEVKTLKGEGIGYRISVKGNVPDCNPDDNLVVRAYKLLKRDLDLAPVDIHLSKYIPSGAGLGGGSSDCAFMIRMLNDMFALGLNLEEMEEYAAKLGADCAFFVRNEPVFATGIGNIFEPVSLSLADYHVLLVKPDVFVSTRDAFSGIKPHRPELCLKEIIRMPVERWRDVMVNDFEDSVFALHPEIAAIKSKMYDLGAVYASMSGSGSSVYGLFRKPVADVDGCFAGCFCRLIEMI